MQRLPLVPLAAVIAGALLLLLNTVYVVKQTEQVLVLQFGAAVRAINAPNLPEAGPGLYVKAPFVESLERFDRRNIGLDLQPTTIITADQEQLIVDAYARYRITDPLKFYGALRNKTQAESQLETVLRSSLRRVLGSVQLDDIISRRRPELMLSIRNEMNDRARRWGVEIIDVRIRQADLPDEVAERVFQRMRTQREQVAAELRAVGDKEAAKIRADADKQITVLLATAKQESDTVRGDGEAKRAAIFARAYNRDPEFAAFYRSLQAYEKSIQKDTPMVLPPDGDFFRYMKNKNGR